MYKIDSLNEISRERRRKRRVQQTVENALGAFAIVGVFFGVQLLVEFITQWV